VIESEGRADREHPLADLQRVCVAELHSGQSVGIDLDRCDVGDLVDADRFAGELPPVSELDGDLARPRDDVRVGQHYPVGSDDEAGAFGADGSRLRIGKIEAAEERRERSVGRAWKPRLLGAPGLFDDADVHHRGTVLLDEAGEGRLSHRKPAAGLDRVHPRRPRRACTRRCQRRPHRVQGYERRDTEHRAQHGRDKGISNGSPHGHVGLRRRAWAPDGSTIDQ
jgi:hypothetical protein